MPQEQLNASCFAADTLEFLTALDRHAVKYMIVGGEAVIFYGYARVTGDIDFFYELTPENTERLFAALRDFWQGSIPGLTAAVELMPPGTIIQFGVPPNRIDLVNRIDGVDFTQAWPNRSRAFIRHQDRDIPLCYLGRNDLVRNKRAVGRPKDLDDLRFLEKPKV
jgi:hypothetical protein